MYRQKIDKIIEEALKDPKNAPVVIDGEQYFSSTQAARITSQHISSISMAIHGARGKMNIEAKIIAGRPLIGREALYKIFLAKRGAKGYLDSL